jgi:hypothetical protein
MNPFFSLFLAHFGVIVTWLPSFKIKFWTETAWLLSFIFLRFPYIFSFWLSLPFQKLWLSWLTILKSALCEALSSKVPLTQSLSPNTHASVSKLPFPDSLVCEAFNSSLACFSPLYLL